VTVEILKSVCDEKVGWLLRSSVSAPSLSYLACGDVILSVARLVFIAPLNAR